MEIKVLAGNIAEIESGAVVIGLFEGETRLGGEAAAVDKALDGAIAKIISEGEIKGKLGEVAVVHTLGRLRAGRVAVAGLGKPSELSPDKVRRATAEVCRFLQKRNVADIAAAVLGAGAGDIAAADVAQAMTEGVLLGVYSFRRHITKEADYGDVRQLVIVAADAAAVPELERGVARGRIIAGATNLARDMVNEPANFMAPADLAGKAAELAKANNLEIEVLEKEPMQELGMGAFLGVSQGSEQPPKMIVLRYRGSPSGGFDLALVGKGITFDSGGISIKPSEKMDEMKGDMAGAAAVIATMGAVARLKPVVNVVAVVPATENLPGGRALKPGDVLQAMNGKTIEIISTDAEGRLILADALSYAGKLGARHIVDVATLTGACMVALGKICTGAFTNNQELLDRVLAAANRAGEYIWQLPMYEEYKEENKSDIADIKNSGGRYGGAITAAQFLAEFAGDVPWVHLDIAGTFLADKERGYFVKGATGVLVRTLVNLVLSFEKSN